MSPTPPDVPNDAVLVLVDIQKGLADPGGGARSNPAAEANAGRLLAAWRAAGMPVVHVRHDSVHPHSALYPGKPGHELSDAVRPLPGERVLSKTVNSAFVGTDLEARLRAEGRRRLVVAGLTAEHCVSSTVRSAADLGFAVTVVSDATATFGRAGPGAPIPAQVMHDVSLAALRDEFASLAETAEVLAALEALSRG